MKFSKIEQDSWLRWSAKKPEDAKICIMGIPFDNAVSLKKGASEGPKRIRELSVDMSDVTEDMIPVDEELLYDLGDIPVTLDWEAYFRQVKEEAYQLMRKASMDQRVPLHKIAQAVLLHKKISEEGN